MDDELLDTFDEHGRPLGIKRRGDVHRDGDWHLAFHLWVVRADGVLLQRRALTKGSWPGFLDASAAGHLLAGETIADGLREVEEELGVVYAFDALAPLGVHRVADRERDGRTNRELQHVFAVRDERALEAWTDFDRAEVDGVVLVSHAGFATLVAGGSDRVAATAWDGVRAAPIAVAAGELVPTPYLKDIAPELLRIAVETEH
ncbi:MAG TPA: NUDIX domain-containing protein [Baekduia sp.]|jgi:isopentenyldiphosphate isomerase